MKSTPTASASVITIIPGSGPTSSQGRDCFPWVSRHWSDRIISSDRFLNLYLFVKKLWFFRVTCPIPMSITKSLVWMDFKGFQHMKNISFWTDQNHRYKKSTAKRTTTETAVQITRSTKIDTNKFHIRNNLFNIGTVRSNIRRRIHGPQSRSGWTIPVRGSLGSTRDSFALFAFGKGGTCSRTF